MAFRVPTGTPICKWNIIVSRFKSISSFTSSQTIWPPRVRTDWKRPPKIYATIAQHTHTPLMLNVCMVVVGSRATPPIYFLNHNNNKWKTGQARRPHRPLTNECVSNFSLYVAAGPLLMDGQIGHFFFFFFFFISSTIRLHGAARFRRVI